MDVDKFVKDIEDKDIELNKNWYYSGVPFTYERYKKILREGIIALDPRITNSNKYNYVTVNRRKDGEYVSKFEGYIIYPRIILDDKIKVIGKEDKEKRILSHSIKTTHTDEYHVYKKIPSKNIMGIIFDIENLIKERPEYTELYLNMLKELAILLTKESRLPLIDGLNKKEINKKKVLSL